MTTNHDHDRDRDPNKPANDNGQAVTPAPAGGALTSLAALQTALANVNTAAVIGGRSGLPMMLFKSREGNGTWGFGQRRTVPEDGSEWAIDPRTFQWGCIAFNESNSRVLGERLVSVSQPKPLITELPDLGVQWQEEWAVNMKCLSGADAGVEVVFKATTDGAIKAVVLMIDQVRDRLNSKHDGMIVPVALLEKDSYPHSQFGKIWFPVLSIVDWMSLDGSRAPASTPAPTTPSSAPPTNDNQPRRRRVG
jgi:hypothetical protein